MRLSTKAFAESTIGEATNILNAANAEGRGPTNEEWEKVKMLGNLYGKTTGNYPPMASGRQFLEWANAPPEGSMTALEVIAGNLNGSGGAPGLPANRQSPTLLVDKEGKSLGAARSGEDFETAVRYAAERRGDVTDLDRKFDGFAADGLTIGNYMRSILMGPANATERAALSESDASGGGYTVPRFLAAQVIGKFLAANRVRQAGATVFEMQSPNHRFARITSLPTCTWGAERGPVIETNMTLGAVEFQAKDLWAVLKFTRNLAQDSPNLSQTMERALQDAFAAEVDRACLFGNGVLEPHGLTSDDEINEVAVGGTLQGYDTLIDGYRELYDDNVPDPTAAIMANEQWEYYAKLKDGDGHYMVRPPMMQNIQLLQTTKATAGTMFLGYWPDFYIGFRLELQIELLRELYAATGEYGLLCHLRMDCGTVRSESFCKLTGIT